MKKLLEYLAIHYNPGGEAFKIVFTSKLVEKSGFTEEEIHKMAIDAYK